VSVALLTSFIYSSYTLHSMGSKLQRPTTPHAIEKKNNFTFSRSGECFIFEGDLRVGKWGEKARGECAAGLFPPGAASAQSLNTMQSHTHTQAK
jgi:hypothetical protein